MNGIVRERLLSKINIDESSGCWVWSAARDGGGYSMFRIDGKTRRAHRVSYELHYGPILNGLFVCHQCDNKLCINPSHLFLGTQARNMADRDTKGRHARLHGEMHGSAKLTEADVLSIRAATGGWGLRDLSAGDAVRTGLTSSPKKSPGLIALWFMRLRLWWNRLLGKPR